MAPAYAVPRMLADARPADCRTSTSTKSTKRSKRRCCARSRRGSRRSSAASGSGSREPLGTIDRSKMNVKGGSVAIGHPFAATGARILATLAKLLAHRGSGRGLISICTAGGMGVTAILER